MSIRVMQSVFDHSESEGSDRLVLLAIADACDHDGTGCWKGRAALAAMSRLSVRTVSRSIDRLVKLGELVVERRDGQSNVYRVTIDPGQPDSGSAAAVSPTPDSDVSGVETPVSREPSSTHPGEPSALVERAAALAATAPKREPFGGDEIKREADTITKTFWESEEPRPMIAGGFVALRAIVEKALRARWSHEQILEALPDCVTRGYSTNVLYTALTRRREQRNRHGGGGTSTSPGGLR